MENNQRDISDQYQRQIDTLKQENIRLKETLKDVKNSKPSFTVDHVSPFDQSYNQRVNRSPQRDQANVDDLVAHFENFDINELQDG